MAPKHGSEAASRRRRRILRAVGSVGLAGILAGCQALTGGSEDESTATDTGTETTTATPTVASGRFDVSDVEPVGVTVADGSPVDVSATVTNESATTGAQELAVTVDGKTAVTKRIELDSGEETTVSFDGIETSSLAPGSYRYVVASNDDEEGGVIDVPAGIPDDVTVLWDGESATLNGWENRNGGTPGWTETADHFQVEVTSGSVQPTESLGDCHLHVEWRTPRSATYTSGQGKGNSGVLIMGTYEVQVLNNYENPTDPGREGGAYYPTEATLQMPARPTFEWQTFDIIFRSPRFEDGEMVRPPMSTILYNGVVVYAHYDIPGASSFPDPVPIEEAHPRDGDGYATEAPFYLQDHGTDTDDVYYRNIWYQDLPTRPVASSSPDERPEYDSSSNGDTYPETVSPGGHATLGKPPGDATVLIDGTLDGWQTAGGGDPGWRTDGDSIQSEPGTGDIETATAFGDSQIHLEVRLPAEADGLGDSAPLSMGDVGIDGFGDSLTPGEWHRIDIVWQGPRFDSGERTHPAQVTTLLDGVAVQSRTRIDDALGADDSDRPEFPVRLRETGSQLQFRNAWVRSLTQA